MFNVVFSGGVFKQQEGQGKADLEEGVIGNQEFDRWAGYKQLFFKVNAFNILIGYSWDWVNHNENFRKPTDHSVQCSHQLNRG